VLRVTRYLILFVMVQYKINFVCSLGSCLIQCNFFFWFAFWDVFINRRNRFLTHRF